MGTKFYLRDYNQSGSLPSQNNFYFDPEVSHNWPTLSTPLALETGSPPPYSVKVIGGNFIVDPQRHFSHVRTFASKPLANTVTISSAGNLTCAFAGGWSNYKLNPYSDLWTWPVMTVYTWNPQSGITHTLSNKDDMDDHFDFITWDAYQSTLSLSSATISSGDRILFEIHYGQEAFYSPWGGYAYEGLSFNHELSYLSFSYDFDFIELIQKANSFKYNIRKNISKKETNFYHMSSYYKISKDVDFGYFLYSYRYITMYLETESSARGEVSLKMVPRATMSFYNYVYDYPNKWVLPNPTLHKFFMIDDFEGYDDLNDAALHWTVSDGLVTFSALKTWSAKNLEDYNVLTFYAKGSLPANLRITFEDKYGSSSNDAVFLITDRWERYETEIAWDFCTPTVVTSINLKSANNSSIIIDDIFMLNHNPETENIDWMKMHLTDINMNRSQKMSTFKIPFKQQELIQFSGERNGEGELRIRSIDTMQTAFLDECLKTNEPLYFRYKNMGLPIVIRNTSRNFMQIIPKQVSSEVSVPFFEIYDYSKF